MSDSFAALRFTNACRISGFGEIGGLTMKLFKKLISAAIFVALGSASLSAAVLLTGATNFGTSSTGVYTNGNGITATSGCCQFLTIENGSTGSGSVSLPLALNAGNTYT